MAVQQLSLLRLSRRLTNAVVLELSCEKFLDSRLPAFHKKHLQADSQWKTSSITNPNNHIFYSYFFGLGNGEPNYKQSIYQTQPTAYSTYASMQSFSYINKHRLYSSPDLILTLLQERAEHYHLSIPRKLTEGRLPWRYYSQYYWLSTGGNRVRLWSDTLRVSNHSRTWRLLNWVVGWSLDYSRMMEVGNPL
jgi:hypothetical protein